jgi:hypothetical protein
MFPDDVYIRTIQGHSWCSRNRLYVEVGYLRVYLAGLPAP